MASFKQDGIQFTSVLPGQTLPNKYGNGDNGIFADAATDGVSPFINAVEIDWNGVTGVFGFDNQNPLKTTGQLLNALSRESVLRARIIAFNTSRASKVNVKDAVHNDTISGYAITEGTTSILYLPEYPTWSTLTGKPNFATVATSGSYNDLTNKPNVGHITSNTVSKTYSAPSGKYISGIKVDSNGHIIEVIYSDLSTQTTITNKWYMGVTNPSTFTSIGQINDSNFDQWKEKTSPKNSISDDTNFDLHKWYLAVPSSWNAIPYDYTGGASTVGVDWEPNTTTIDISGIEYTIWTSKGTTSNMNVHIHII